MISMVEKINRCALRCCSAQLASMLDELRLHRGEFLGGGYSLDFEKEWFSDMLTTKRLSIVPTLRCTLRCKIVLQSHDQIYKAR
jgi:hypothetical protein